MSGKPGFRPIRPIRPKRGEIYLTNFGPTVGAEIRKLRPAMIIQNDTGNFHSPVTIVAAITTQFKLPLFPTEVFIPTPEGGLNADSVILCNQLRTIDKRRLSKRLGKAGPELMRRVDEALTISLDLR